MMKYLLILLSVLIIPICAASEQLNPEIKFPPYPDVWGYDLSDYQAVRENISYIRAYDAPNGDIVFIFRTEGVPMDALNRENWFKKDKFKILKFFEQKIIDAPKDIDTFLEENGLVRTGDWSIKFDDGIVIKFSFDNAGKLCPTSNLKRRMLIKGKPDASGFLGTRGSEVYSVLAAMPNIYRIYDQRGEGECPPGSETLYSQLYFIAIELIKLKDDTFILFDISGNLILRFDKNMKTKFKPEHGVAGTELKRNFFVVPYSMLEDINGIILENNEPWVQSMHDRLLQYFEEQEKQGKFD